MQATSAPSSASANAMPRPIPTADPVTTAIYPSSNMVTPLLARLYIVIQ